MKIINANVQTCTRGPAVVEFHSLGQLLIDPGIALIVINWTSYLKIVSRRWDELRLNDVWHQILSWHGNLKKIKEI